MGNGMLSLSTKAVERSQIMSGLVARRGTWAARVCFSDFWQVKKAKQAFWLYSPMHGSLGSESETRWNEIDYEWWNTHSNTQPDHHWLRTGHTVGDTPEDHGGVDDVISEPLCSPQCPYGAEEYTWSCELESLDGTVQELKGPDCSAVILGQYDGGTGLGVDGYMVLLIHVSDGGVDYEVKAYGTDGAELRASSSSSRVPNLPLAAMFLQEYAVGATDTFDIDWFYYSPDVSPTIDAVLDHVSSSLENSARHNNTGLRLAVPDGELGDCSTELEITLPKPIPETMTPGETVCIVALPPLRHGRFRYTWWHIPDYGETKALPISITPYYGGWEADFAFPQGAIADTLTIRLEEVKEGEACEKENDIVKPIERSWVIHSRWARPDLDAFLESANAWVVTDQDLDRSENAVGLHSYPNPFNPQTTVSFTLPEAAFVRLKVVDLTGRVVNFLAGEHLSAGTHSVNWDASGVPSGVYVAVLQSGHERISTPLVVAR